MTCLAQNATGILNSDFERRTATATYGTDESKMEKTIYYYPKTEFASYNSIIMIMEVVIKKMFQKMFQNM